MGAGGGSGFGGFGRPGLESGGMAGGFGWGIVVEEVRDSVVNGVPPLHRWCADYYIWWCRGVVPMV